MQAITTVPLRAKTMVDFVQFDAPTTEQVAVLNALQSFVAPSCTDDFMVVCGSAGTGKSSIMNAVVKYASQEKIRVQIAAPTGRAARLISAKSDSIATTLHSMLFSVSSKKDDAVVKFTPKKDKVEDYSIFIIDEASMVNSKVIPNNKDQLFLCDYTILNTITHFVKSGNVKNKVIFIGDRYQLSPVGENHSNALYPQYLKDKYVWKGSEFHLTEVKRQGKDSYILETATEIRNSIENELEIPTIKAPSLKNIFNAIPKYINDLQEFGPSKVIAIAKSNKQCSYFNKAVRKNQFGSSAPLLMHNDVIVIRRNWHRNGIALHNGDTAIIKEVYHDQKEIIGGLHFLPVKIRVKNNANKEIEVMDYLLMDTVIQGVSSLGFIKENILYAERHRVNKTYRETGNVEDDRYLGALRATYGYCITCNIAQGGEWDKVFLNNFKIPDARWAYTAVTRAKNELFLF